MIISNKEPIWCCNCGKRINVDDLIFNGKLLYECSNCGFLNEKPMRDMIGAWEKQKEWKKKNVEKINNIH